MLRLTGMLGIVGVLGLFAGHLCGAEGPEAAGSITGVVVLPSGEAAGDCLVLAHQDGQKMGCN